MKRASNKKLASRRGGEPGGTNFPEIRAAAGKQYLGFVRRYLKSAIALVPRAPREVSGALVGDATMSRLHARFMQVDGPTDVLTFELGHDAGGRCVAGEIVVCVPEARRQSARHGTHVEHELLLYFVHGLLHLTGHDDHDEVAYERMHRAEDRVLTRLGVGPVFRPDGAGRRLAEQKVNGSRR